MLVISCHAQISPGTYCAHDLYCKFSSGISILEGKIFLIIWHADP